MLNETIAPSIQVPIIDFSPFLTGNDEGQKKVAQEIAQACQDVGFFYLRNHGVPEELIERVFAQSKHFFALPLPIKNRIPWDESNRGYDGVESQTFDPNKPGDLKESFLYGKTVDPEAATRWKNSPYAPLLSKPNKWLPEYPEFQATMLQMLDECDKVTFRVLEAFAIALALPETYFTNLHTQRDYTMRLLHYPFLTKTPKEEQPRLGAHSDWGSITVLFQDDAGGLEACTTQGEWIPVPPIPNTIVVNTGDLMQMWTNDRFRSTPHRVTIPENFSTVGERYSVVCFAVPNYDVEIAALDCQGEGEPPKYQPVTAGEYLMQKLQETY